MMKLGTRWMPMKLLEITRPGSKYMYWCQELKTAMMSPALTMHSMGPIWACSSHVRSMVLFHSQSGLPKVLFLHCLQIIGGTTLNMSIMYPTLMWTSTTPATCFCSTRAAGPNCSSVSSCLGHSLTASCPRVTPYHLDVSMGFAPRRLFAYVAPTSRSRDSM